MTDQAVTLMFVVVVIFIIFLIFSKIHPSMFVCVVIFIIILVMLFNVRHCQFFGNVHRFRSYSIDHLDLVK